MGLGVVIGRFQVMAKMGKGGRGRRGFLGLPRAGRKYEKWVEERCEEMAEMGGEQELQ